MSHAPAWPRWTVPVVLVAVIVLGALTGVVAALAAAIAGADELTPATVLLANALLLAGTWLLLRAVARRDGIDLRPEHLGVRPVAPRMGLVVLAFGLAVALVAAGLTGLLADLDLEHPEELGPPIAVVQLDLGTVASVLGRAVLAGLATEVLLRGFALPALMGPLGRTGAILGVALLTALPGPVELAPATAAIGVALCVMYLESGSILPGVALSAGAQAYVLALSFGWSVPEAAGLAVPAALVAFALAWSWDRGPRRS